MVNLILRPSGLEEKYNKPWSLQLRHHGSYGETEYDTLCRVDDNTAKQIILAGAPYWLFGEPDWNKRYKLRQLEKARELEEKAKLLKDRIKISEGSLNNND